MPFLWQNDCPRAHRRRDNHSALQRTAASCSPQLFAQQFRVLTGELWHTATAMQEMTRRPTSRLGVWKPWCLWSAGRVQSGVWGLGNVKQTWCVFYSLWKIELSSAVLFRNSTHYHWKERVTTSQTTPCINSKSVTAVAVYSAPAVITGFTVTAMRDKNYAEPRITRHDAKCTFPNVIKAEQCCQFWDAIMEILAVTSGCWVAVSLLMVTNQLAQMDLWPPASTWSFRIKMWSLRKTETSPSSNINHSKRVE